MLVDPHPSKQHHVRLQPAFYQMEQEVTMPEARFNPTLPETSEVDGESIRCQHILVSCFNNDYLVLLLSPPKLISSYVFVSFWIMTWLSLCFEPIQLQGHISLRLAIDHLTYLGTSMQPTESIVKRTTQPWSFLAAGDEASYLPNCQIWLLPFMQSVVFRNFIKTTSYLWT